MSAPAQLDANETALLDECPACSHRVTEHLADRGACHFCTACHLTEAEARVAAVEHVLGLRLREATTQAMTLAADLAETYETGEAAARGLRFVATRPLVGVQSPTTNTDQEK